MKIKSTIAAIRRVTFVAIKGCKEGWDSFVVLILLLGASFYFNRWQLAVAHKHRVNR